MNGMKKISVILLLLSLTACASRVQRTVYYDYRPPVSHASVQATVHRYQPIEVTVYAERVYRGGFTSIQLVLVDGDYAEIPMRNKKGHYSRIFAHYHAGILHFDADKNCHGLRGASRFQQDNGWHQGRMYTRVSAGKDYDLTGLKLMIKHVDPSRKPAVANNNKDRHEKDRKIHPEHADVDKNSPFRDRLPKSVQKHSFAGKNISVSQKISADQIDGRMDKKPMKTEKQASAANKTRDSSSQSVSGLNRATVHEQSHGPVTKARKIVTEKADREKNQNTQKIKLSKNKQQRMIPRETSAERNDPAEQPKAHNKPDRTQVEKSKARHEPKDKEKNAVAENKQVEKDRKGKKNKDAEDESDEDISLDDKRSQGKGRNRHAT